MPVYFRTPEMEGGGPFYCFNCKRMLAIKIKGNCHIQFHCPRCKAFISIALREPINLSKWKGTAETGEVKKEGEVG